MDAKFHIVVVALLLVVNCPAARGQKDQDRFGLGKRPQVYLVHKTASSNFRIEGPGSGVMAGAAIGTVARVRDAQEAADVQQKFDLRDPVTYLKDRLSEALRRELGLTNLLVVAAAVDLPMIPERPEDMSDEERAASKAGTPTKAVKPTFKEQYPEGVVIEVVTRHWGMDNYKMKYYASVWATDLTQSKRLLGSSCSWVIFDQVDERKMPAHSAFDQQGKYDPSAFDAHTTAMKGEIYGNNGAPLKANLRKAAEFCADRMVGRFVGDGKERRVQIK